jgi:hypothetical protein
MDSSTLKESKNLSYIKDTKSGGWNLLGTTSHGMANGTVWCSQMRKNLYFNVDESIVVQKSLNGSWRSITIGFIFQFSTG